MGKITLEDYKKYVRNRPIPDTFGFYKIWRLKCKDTGYICHEIEYIDEDSEKVVTGLQWRFPIPSLSEMEFEYYPTFDEAYAAMTKPSCIESSIAYKDSELKHTFGYQISRLGYGSHGTRDFYIDYRHYDRFHNEYDRATCSSYHWNTPGIYGKFLGRFPEQIAFKNGDLVEIGVSRYEDDNKEYSVLGVVIGTPLTVEEVWDSICDEINKQDCENPIESYFEAPDMCGVDVEEYFILYGPVNESLSYATFRHPSEVRPPSFEVPKKAKETMKKYYDEYIKSIRE